MKKMKRLEEEMERERLRRGKRGLRKRVLSSKRWPSRGAPQGSTAAGAARTGSTAVGAGAARQRSRQGSVDYGYAVAVSSFGFSGGYSDCGSSGGDGGGYCGGGE